MENFVAYYIDFQFTDRLGLTHKGRDIAMYNEKWTLAEVLAYERNRYGQGVSITVTKVEG